MVIKLAIIYVSFLIIKVNTVINSDDKLWSCVNNVDDRGQSGGTKNLINLIEHSTVILKAFCSEHLISYVEAQNSRRNISDENSVENNEIDFLDDNGENYDDYYLSPNSNEANRKRTLLTFTPQTIYKGTRILRRMEMFNNQEYFEIKG